jgi:hypothetical protein
MLFVHSIIILSSKDFFYSYSYVCHYHVLCSNFQLWSKTSFLQYKIYEYFAFQFVRSVTIVFL